MLDFGVYAGLFGAAFLAATLLPMQSEALLVALLVAGKQPVFFLLLSASLGNVLGSCLNWFLGRYMESLKHRKWFPVKSDDLERAQHWYRRYGRWSLLLSWVPVIGDPLTLLAGVLREPFVSFFVLVAVAKVARYCLLAAIVFRLVV